MSEPDLSTWLTKQQAADALHVSTKTVESFAKDRKIQQGAWRPHGRGAEKAVYNPDDVARLAKERRPGLAPFVLPAGSTLPVSSNGNGNGHHPPTVALSKPEGLPSGEEILKLVFAAALRSLTSETPSTSQTSEKLFLTIPEAAAVSGLSQAHLLRKCRDCWTGAMKDGSTWKIRRKDLEGL